mmetsp:Transcript_4129/g.4732  ORF Transcript_4129/g.4732 Transcript_4129/m.4732 type:complete len:779 (-) Transcript_4129:152-2488(-)
MPKRTKGSGAGSKTKRTQRRAEKFGGKIAKPAKTGGIKKHSVPKHRPAAGVGAHGEDGDSAPRKKTFKAGSGNKKPFNSKKKPEQKPEKKGPMTKADIKKAAEELKMTRKLFRKPSYGVIQELTLSWEKFRAKTTTPEDKLKVFDELLPKVKGKVVEVATDHKGSRVLQAILKDCSEKQRAVIEAEIKTDLITVAKSQYGNFVVRAMLEKAKKPELARLLGLFKNKVTAVARHPCAAAVLDIAYNLANKAQKAAIIAEFYGAEFAVKAYSASVSGGEPLTLEDALKDLSKEGKKSLIGHATKCLTPMWEKGMVSFNFAHRVFAEFIQIAPPLCKADMCEHLAGDVALIRMMHTLDGIRTVCTLINWAGAKDRKKMIKTLKSTVGKIASDEYGNMVLVCAMEAVDDTVLMKKIVINEIKAALDEIVAHKHARRCILHLLAPRSPRYFPPLFTALLPSSDGSSAPQTSKLATPSAGVPYKPVGPSGVPMRNTEDDDGDEEPSSMQVDADDDEGEGEGKGSKKDPAKRRRELLEGKGGLAESLVQYCIDNADAMLRDRNSADVLMETARGGTDGMVAEIVGVDQMRALHNTIAELAAAPRVTDPDADEGIPEHLLEQFVSSRMLRQMALEPSLSTVLTSDGWSDFPCFGATLWKGALKGRCADWVGTHAEKVLAAIGSCGDANVMKALSAEVSKCIKPKSVEEWLAGFVQKQGQDQLQGSKGGKGSKLATPDAKGKEKSVTPAKRVTRSKAKDDGGIYSKKVEENIAALSEAAKKRRKVGK